MKSKKILIIDDSDDFRAVVRNYLKIHNSGLEVFEASSGEMGITKASCVRPDIVLMDLNLPHANGFEITQQIKDDHPACQVIVLTMFEVPLFKEKSLKVGAVDFISKNEVFDRLLPAIKACMEHLNLTRRKYESCKD